MVNRWIFAVAALVAVLLAVVAVFLRRPAEIRYQRASTAYGVFTITLLIPEETQPFQDVPLVIEVTNTSGHEEKLPLGGRPANDFSIADGRGRTIWQMGYGVAAEDILEFRLVQSGETLSFKQQWDQRENDGSRIELGTYYVQGLINVGDPPQKIELGPLPLKIGR